MRIVPLLLAAGLVASVSAHAATKVVTVDFENIPGASSGAVINTLKPGYAGLTWSSSFSVIKAADLLGTGYDYGTLGTWAAYSAYGNPVWFSAAQTFSFYGIYLASAWHASDNLVVSGWRNGSQIYNQTVEITNSQDVLPKLYQFNWKNVDKVSFSTTVPGSGHQVVFDNLQISPLAPVPEPETLALSGIALAGLALRMRRKAVR